MIRIELVLGAAALCVAVAAAGAPNKLGLCSACHQDDGCSRLAGTPHLAGQDRAYLVKALGDYREGRRSNAAMNAVAGSLSARDVDALADWFSTRTPCRAAP